MSKEIISDYFDSHFRDVLTTLIENNDELLFSFIANRRKHQEEFFTKIYDILLQIGDMAYSKSDVGKYLDIFFSEDETVAHFYFELSAILASKIFVEDYSGDTKEADLMKYIRTNNFWIVLPKAIKKCLNSNLYSATIDQDILNGYPNAIIGKIISGFNVDANSYKRDTEPGLHLLLHKKYYHKKARIQKKNITRVRRQARKIVMLYMTKYPRGRAFVNGLEKLPDEFIVAIRRKYF